MNTGNLTLSFLVGAFLIGGISCEAIYPKSRRQDIVETPVSAEGLSSEEQELLGYCRKVQDISQRQEDTENKVEKILTIVEAQKNTPFHINAKQKEELRKSWVEIEKSRREALKNLQEDSNQDTGEEYLP
jgi:hypothetical protein